MTKRLYFFLLFLPASLFSLAAGYDSSSKNQGEKIYRENCAVCHGEEGNGKTHAANALNPKPRDFTSPLLFQELSEQRMIKTVREGKAGSAMMSWKYNLTPEEIKEVVRFIRRKFMQTDSLSSPELEEGRKIYQENCVVCHGEKGNGKTWAARALNPRPRNFTDPWVKKYLAKERMLKSITEGRSQTAMVSWKYNLTQRQINNVVNYIRTVFMKKNKADPPLSPLNLERGKAIYKQNCSPCHGLKGNGKGPRAKFILPPPRNFTDQEEMKGIDEFRMLKSVTEGRPGTVMISWKDVLSKEQIRDVVGYINRSLRN